MTPTEPTTSHRDAALARLETAHRRRLEAHAAYRAALADEDDAVLAARRAGNRWRPIADVLHVTEQQARNKAAATGRPLP